MIALLFAILAMFAQPHDIPDSFRDIVLRCDTPIVEVGVFIGCESNAPDGEHIYAGLTWIYDSPTLVTGP